MELLRGKKILVSGVANNMSLAAPMARTFKEHGAHVAITYQNEPTFAKHALKFAKSIGIDESHAFACDVTVKEDVERCLSGVRDLFDDELDGFVHSIGWTDPPMLKVPFVDVLASEGLRENFRRTMEISVFSFLDMSYRARELMKKKRGGSIVTLTYDASNLAIEFYNLMAGAKGALEAFMRGLALAFGEDNIRVNAISASPEKTVSGLAVGNAYRLGSSEEAMSPFGRRATPEEIANMALYLMSDLSTATTGQNMYVNCGRNSVGAAPIRNDPLVLKALGTDPKQREMIPVRSAQEPAVEHSENAGIPTETEVA